jgi:hypothetical protein
MTVQEVQEQIVRDKLLAQIATEAQSQRAPRICGNCRQIGHNRRRYPDA